MTKQNHNRPPLLTNDTLGKIQPQAPELETAVLGALLTESKAYQTVENLLQANDFYVSAHQTIYKAISKLASRHAPVDMMTVVEELKTMGELDTIGGPMYIVDLTEKVASSAHLQYHAQIIKQKSKARKIIEIMSDVRQKAFDDTQDIHETLEQLEKAMTELSSNASTCEPISIGEALTQAINKASETQKLREQGINLSIPTGLASLDETLAGGWSSPDLIILGGRPSMGKTQHSLSFAKSAAMQGKDVLFVSMEMTATQLVNRFLLEDERINSYNLRMGEMSPEEWTAMDERAGILWNMRLHIADNHNIRYLNNIKSEARRLHRKGLLKLMIIDYLGLIQTNIKFSNRYLEVGFITAELKNLAKELDVPIILLSQLSRPTKDTTAVPEPQLADLRESGNIEQDADIVLFIHKPDYYEPDIIDSKGKAWRGRGKLIIGKYREGIRNQALIFYHDECYKKIWG